MRSAESFWNANSLCLGTLVNHCWQKGVYNFGSLSASVTGVAIAFATVVFQTITNNRILTPSLIGLDSLYQLFQTFIIFSFGSMSVRN